MFTKSKTSLMPMTALFALSLCTLEAQDKKMQNETQPERTYKPYYYDQSSKGFFLYGEWLRWKPFLEDSMNWVDKKERAGAFQKDKVEELELNWSNGYRVGFGYRFARDTGDSWIRPWQFEAYYTHYHSHDKRAAQGEPSPGIAQGTVLLPVVPVISPNGPGSGYDLGTTPTHAESEVHLHYRTVDAKMAWPIWMRENVILRLMAGGIFAKITDHWDTEYKTESPGIAFLKTNSNFDWSFIGGGLELGADIHVALPQGLGFYLDGDCGLLVGRIRKVETYKVDPLTAAVVQQEWSRHDKRFEPMFRFEAGFDYKHWFRKSWMLHLALSYEVQLWINMNQFGKTNDRADATPINSPFGTTVKVPFIGNFFDNSPSNLGFHGLNARVGVDF